jgi:TatD-related deoxyribonuclease
VKHYARSVLSSREPTGVVPSYLAQRGTFRDALERPGPWLLETDYLDDPRRPGAVLDLATIPRRAESLLRGGAGAAERLRVPFEASVERVYGFRPTVDRSARR